MKTKKIDYYLNFIIVILEAIGLIISISTLKNKMFLYYTQDSNILLLLASLLYLINYDNRKNNKEVSLLKYGATVSVVITFLVVIFILAPTTDLTYRWLMFEDANLYYHTLCPILGFVSFMFYDDIKIKGFKDVLISLAFTIGYTVLFVFLNLLKIVYGPYPFLHLYENPWYLSLFYFVLIDGGALLLAKLLEIGKNRKQTK